MGDAGVLQGSAANMTEKLRVAQEAMHLPEVQEMLRKLAEYNLGICMPHMHDDAAGEFLPLPDDVVQVETDLEVTFKPSAEICQQLDRYVPVAWLWRGDAAGSATVASTCYSYCEKPAPDKNHVWKHRKE